MILPLRTLLIAALSATPVLVPAAQERDGLASCAAAATESVPVAGRAAPALRLTAHELHTRADLAAPVLRDPEQEPVREPAARELHVDLALDGSIVAGSIAVAAMISSFRDDLAPSSCRWCGTNRFDTWARDELLWGDADAAELASDVGIVVVPAGVAAALALSGRDGPRVRILEDLLLVAEALGVTKVGDAIPKLTTGRLRPYARFGTASTGSADDRLSFWSGHSSFAFAAASAGATVARLRGYSRWRWILGAGMAGAAATAWLRVAGDRHWTTDALAGAAWGTAVGVAVPLLHVREERRASVVPTGRGAVLVIVF